MGLGDKAEELAEKAKEALTGDAESQEEQPEADDEWAGDAVADAQWEVDEHIQIDDKR
jgi:hypothetical protein